MTLLPVTHRIPAIPSNGITDWQSAVAISQATRRSTATNCLFRDLLRLHLVISWHVIIDRHCGLSNYSIFSVLR